MKLGHGMQYACILHPCDLLGNDGVKLSCHLGGTGEFLVLFDGVYSSVNRLARSWPVVVLFTLCGPVQTLLSQRNLEWKYLLKCC